ncbi:uncharacterized protein ACN2A1_009784 isoform 1-T2 [Glossina fuscipes fuscipes]
MTKQERTGKTDEPTGMANLRSPDLFSDDIYISDPSTSNHARLIKQPEEANAEKEIQKRRIAAYEGQLEEANAEKEIQKRRIGAYEAQLEEANAEKDIQKHRIAAYEAQLEKANGEKNRWNPNLIAWCNVKNPNYTENHEFYVGTQTDSLSHLFIGLRFEGEGWSYFFSWAGSNFNLEQCRSSEV